MYSKILPELWKIFRVTEYLRNVIREEGGDPDRETLAAIKTKNGCTYLRITRDNLGEAITSSMIRYVSSLWRNRNSSISQETVSDIS